MSASAVTKSSSGYLDGLKLNLGTEMPVEWE